MYVCTVITDDDTACEEQINHASKIFQILQILPFYCIKPFEFYCIKQIDNIFPCVYVYCSRSQKTSHPVKNNSHAT